MDVQRNVDHRKNFSVSEFYPARTGHTAVLQNSGFNEAMVVIAS